MGCLPHATLDSFSPEQSTSNFELIDARPEIQKENDRGNLWNRFDCSFAVVRIGDVQTTPERLPYLKKALLRDTPSFVFDQRILVKDFVIFYNNQFSARQTPWVKPGSLEESAAQAMSTQDCYQSKGDPAYFTDEENPESKPAYIVQITLDRNGERFGVRHVHPFRMWFSGWEANQFLFPAIDQAIAKLVGKIRMKYKD